MLERLQPSQDPPLPRAVEKPTPQRRYWKRLEPSYMQEVPSLEFLTSKQQRVVGNIHELMDAIAKRAMAKNERFGDVHAFIAWGVSDCGVSQSDAEELTNWFKPTHH